MVTYYVSLVGHVERVDPCSAPRDDIATEDDAHDYEAIELYILDVEFLDAYLGLSICACQRKRGIYLRKRVSELEGCRPSRCVCCRLRMGTILVWEYGKVLITSNQQWPFSLIVECQDVYFNLDSI